MHRGYSHRSDQIRSVTQSCLILCSPVNCSPSGFAIHGIFQARILEWVAISFSRGSFWASDSTQVSCIFIGRWILYHCATWKPIINSTIASQVALVVKNLPANAVDIKDSGSIPGLGRSPGRGNGNLFQYSCLQNPVDRGTLWATVHMVAKSWRWLKRLNTEVT